MLIFNHLLVHGSGTNLSPHDRKAVVLQAQKKLLKKDNEIFEKDGITFAVSENNSTVPVEFNSELKFNLSKLPSEPGEYSVNYETGEVFLVGADEDREGTADNNYVASYNYRYSFEDGLDYSLDGNDFVANNTRITRSL